jgi:hypothetical protein
VQGGHDVVVVARPTIEGARAQTVTADLGTLLARARLIGA